MKPISKTLAVLIVVGSAMAAPLISTIRDPGASSVVPGAVTDGTRVTHRGNGDAAAEGTRVTGFGTDGTRVTRRGKGDVDTDGTRVTVVNTDGTRVTRRSTDWTRVSDVDTNAGYTGEARE